MKFSQRQSNTIDVLQRFEAIPMKNKLCFTPLEYESSQCKFVHVKALEQLNIQGGDETPFTLDAVDICEIINQME